MPVTGFRFLFSLYVAYEKMTATKIGVFIISCNPEKLGLMGVRTHYR